MIILRNQKVALAHTNLDLEKKIIKALNIKKEELISYEVVKKAIDSRRKNDIHYVYNFHVQVKNERRALKLKNVDEAKLYTYPVRKIENEATRPVIIGSGPAGLMAGIVLAESGLKPIIIEQGKDVAGRKADIEKFWATGDLNLMSNVQFGAGGAGTFSDGKLTTGVNNPRKLKLIDAFIKAGAPEEIRYSGKPHLGTDILEDMVTNMCQQIENLGGEIRFETKFIDFKTTDNKLSSIVTSKDDQITEIDCDYVILAIGHSARDTFEMIHTKEMEMKAKPFAVGVRIEHLQTDVNKCQYGKAAEVLDAASYKANVRMDERTLHTFCMCPGGVVVGAASENGRLVTNGMSYFNRDLVNSNSALLVNVKVEDFEGDKHPLNGIKFQRELEEAAFKAGGSNYYAPVQKVGDFLNNKKSTSFDKVKPTYLPGTTSVNLHEVFPEFITKSLKEGLEMLQDKIDFFTDSQAVLTAIESRSSSPVTIIRDENLMSSIDGIIPCGEGAGYAGGIVSAGIDGIRCAEAVLDLIENK